MGAKSKVSQVDGLKEFIISKSDGGKNTIVYVTDEVAQWLRENNLKIKISREAIRKVIKTHEEEIEDTRRSIEAARAMAEILKDNPGTEATEAVVMTMSGLIAKEVRQVESLEFENPNDMVNALTRLADTQLKMSAARTKAVQALDRAKSSLKAELKSAIASDPELLDRLCRIIDGAEI